MGSKLGDLKTIGPKWVQVQATKNIYVHWCEQRRAECFSLLREFPYTTLAIEYKSWVYVFAFHTQATYRPVTATGGVVPNPTTKEVATPCIPIEWMEEGRGSGGIPTGVGGIRRCLSGCLRGLGSSPSTNEDIRVDAVTGAVVAGRGQAHRRLSSTVFGPLTPVTMDGGLFRDTEGSGLLPSVSQEPKVVLESKHET